MSCEWIIKKTSLRCKNSVKNGKKYCWMHVHMNTNSTTEENTKSEDFNACLVCGMKISKDDSYCSTHSCKIKKCGYKIYINNLCMFHSQSELAFWRDYIYKQEAKPNTTKPNTTRPNTTRPNTTPNTSKPYINPQVEISLKYFELPVNTTFKDIKSKFREFALKLHPDKPGGSHDKFDELSKHYNILIKHYSK